MNKKPNLPPVVSPAEWQAAHETLLVAEKAATRARDALAALRRRQPMVRIDKDYDLEGPNGEAKLLELFEGRRQLILYHFMFGPGAHGWPHAGCDGCSMFVDQVGHRAHLNARDTSFALVSIAPIADIARYRQRMGWTIWPERLLARRWRRLSHLFHVRTGGRGSRECVDLSRFDAVRPARRVGSVSGRVATKRALRVVAPPRRIREFA